LHLTPGAEDECWPWRGEISPKGYGIVYAKENRKWRRRKAHRVAYDRAHGPIPDGMLVIHSCDNPPCCNPKHLRVGTHADNAEDRSRRGRHRTRVLRRSDAVEIRRLKANGYGWEELAAAYGVSRALIEDIVTGTKWKDAI
jgi:hypothetical protein